MWLSPADECSASGLPVKEYVVSPQRLPYKRFCGGKGEGFGGSVRRSRHGEWFALCFVVAVLLPAARPLSFALFPEKARVEVQEPSDGLNLSNALADPCRFTHFDPQYRHAHPQNLGVVAMMYSSSASRA